MLTKFTFDDNAADWHLTATSFLPGMNLFVGPSGAGKKRLLESVLWAVWAAGGNASSAIYGGCSWRLEATINGRDYVWAVEMDASTRSPHLVFGDVAPGGLEYSNETVTESGHAIYSRRGASIAIDDKAQVPTSVGGSALVLYQTHPGIAPLRNLLARSRNSATNGGGVWFPRVYPVGTLSDLLDAPESPILHSSQDIWLAAYRLAVKDPERFTRWIVEPFQEAFPLVDHVLVGLATDLDPVSFKVVGGDAVAFGVRERGVRSPVVGQRLSSGMRKLLILLLEVELVSPGSCLLIDEVENGYGINVLPAVAQALTRRTDIQVIANSHHPQLIPKIPRSAWRLVTRKGSQVTVVDVDKIESMGGSLKLDSYTRLMNLHEYEEAVR